MSEEPREASMRAYARMRGVARTTIQAAVQDGRIRVTSAGAIDVAAADASWYAAHTARQQGSGQRQVDRAIRARVAAGAARVQLASHRFAELEAAYVEREHARRELHEDIDELLAAIHALPDAEAEMVAGDLGRDHETAVRVLTAFTGVLIEDIGDLHQQLDQLVDGIA